MMKLTTHSEMETHEIGVALWQRYGKTKRKKAVIFALEGELGVGKTQLVKGLAKAMRIKDDVISPTFTLEAEYDLGKLIHIDAWRIENSEELLRMGIKKRVADKRIIIIEWADKVMDVLKKITNKSKLVTVKIMYGSNDDERIIEIDEK